MFESLVKSINEAGGSVRAYDACSREARARIADEPQNAVARGNQVLDDGRADEAGRAGYENAHEQSPQ